MTGEQFVDEESLRRIEELRGPFELGHAYARVNRATIMPDGAFETDGEHAISLAIMATCYATKYHPELDPYKVFFYSVMHDIDEHLHGDMNTVGATKESFAEKDRLEKEGDANKRNVLAAFPAFLAMLDVMENIENPESAFGKAMDKLAPGYTHRANGGKAIKEHYGISSYEELIDAVGLTDEKMRKYAAAFVDVLAMRQEMHRHVARVAFGTDKDT